MTGQEPGTIGAPIEAHDLDDHPAGRSFWASLRYFALGRMLLAAVLVMLASLERSGVASRLLDDPELFGRAAIAYLFVSVAFLSASFVRRRFQLQFFAQVTVDLVLLLGMIHAAGGARSGFGVLMVAAVAGAAVLTTARWSAFLAATATLLVLAESGWRVLAVEPPDPGELVSAALIGTACFVTAALVNWLATRLAAQENLASQRGVDLRTQLAVNQLVIAELPQGVVVADEQGAVRTMNRSAQAMLGAQGPWPGVERLVRNIDREALPAVRKPLPGAAVEFISDVSTLVSASMPQPGSHKVRVRVLRPTGLGRSDTVLLIDDLRQLEERAQQLKLASMGRLSASIAHEIRNPLAAIRHANSLLAEQVDTPVLRRLSGIVETNTVRIDRVVQDVLSVARRESPNREAIDVARFLDSLRGEFVAMAQGRTGRVEVEVLVDDPLAFDPGHLRQVLVNLIANALRYSSQQPGSVRLVWRRGTDDRLEFLVADDGPGLPPDMIEHAFEPFFTTEARGTGLGLYLAREICAANGADLRYELASPGGRHAGAFVILPAQPDAPPA